MPFANIADVRRAVLFALVFMVNEGMQHYGTSRRAAALSTMILLGLIIWRRGDWALAHSPIQDLGGRIARQRGQWTWVYCALSLVFVVWTVYATALQI